MIKIKKYEIPVESIVKINLPSDAKIIGCGMVFDKLYLFIVEDDLLPKEERTLRIAAAGHKLEIDEENNEDTFYHLIGSVEFSKNVFYHLFEIMPLYKASYNSVIKKLSGVYLEL